MIQDMITRYCKNAGIDNWPRTTNGAYSTDQKQIEQFAVEGTIIKQFQRHNNKLSSLKAFSPDKNGKINAMQHIDEDYIQHPDYAPHGTQTDRHAHKTISFMPANPHWMRIMMEPAEGGAFVEFDLTTGEVGIKASITDDQMMKQAYMANDFYMAYAQQAGTYPSNLPIPTEEQRDEEWFKPHKPTRVTYKALCLSLQFGAGYKSIAYALAAKEHTPVDLDRAKALVDEYHATYHEAASVTARLKEILQEGAGILLPNGWRFGKDYKSILSALNVPVQGTGSCILQEICKRVDNEGFNIIATFHDSITVYCAESQVSAVSKRVPEIILDACEAVLGERILKVGKPEVVRHGDWWIHGKGAKDWERYKFYFIPNEPVVNAPVTL